MNIKTASSNVIFSDFPDPDVIRVGNTYYMVSTTMHFYPGCVILKSFNLVDWEIASYVFDQLDGTPGQKLEDQKGTYGQGMWAATIRFHDNKFYVAFVANDTHKTYLFNSDKIEGPWKKSNIQGFYHDMSLLFDDDGRVFCVSGNTEIRLVEMEKDLSGPKKNGIDKIIVKEKDDVILGYEGSHIYKINGKYYVFFIHWPKGKLRTEACYVSDSIEGPYEGKDVLCCDYKKWQSGVAQGGIVDTPEGDWYGMLFQDHGALGRMPVLVPVSFVDDFPVFGKDQIAPEELSVLDLDPGYKYAPLYSSNFLEDDDDSNDDNRNNCANCGNNKKRLSKNWQWNHTPDLQYVKFTENSFTITNSHLAKNPCLCKNTLTQRCFTEHCQATVSLDFSNLKDGDVAGLCALEGDYGFIGIEKRQSELYIIYAERGSPVEPYKIGSVDNGFPKIIAEEKLNEGTTSVTLTMKVNLEKENQTASFYYVTGCERNAAFANTTQISESNTAFVNRVPLSKTETTPANQATIPAPLGTKKLSFTLDQFVGVRFALFSYGTKSTGGKASFSNFIYKVH